MKLSLTQWSERKTVSNDAPSREMPSTPARGTRPPMRLADVLHGVEGDSASNINGNPMTQLGCDSRKVQPGSLFFALHGAKTDGNAFVKDAVERGAVAIVSEERQPADLPERVLWIRVREARKSLAIAAANFFGHPASVVKMAAVTGTGGKTTTTSITN